jgi:DNA (cytosine-5)-methyltransferase 1
VLTFGSLFACVGGLDLGLERVGLRCIWQCELDEYRRRILARHWPDVVRHPDVRSFPPSDPSEWSCDLICGGDPCQANSRAGVARREAGEGLGGKFIRVVDEIRPRLVLRENPSATRPDAPWPWWRFRAALESLGYAVLPFRLRACCVGADHQRDRLFLLAELADAHRKPIRLSGCGEDARATRAVQGEASQRQRLRPDTRPILCAEGNRDDADAPRTTHGIPRGMDGKRMRALGDAVYPDVAETIGRFIVEANVPAVSLP